MPKKHSLQSKFKKTKFQYDQYWKVDYTESFEGFNSSKRYCAIIKSPSAEHATRILKKKLHEDDRSSILKSLSINMFHKDFKLNGISLDIYDWENIRNAAFPNPVNILFKHEQVDSNH